MILDAEKLGKDHSKTESGQSACENWFSQASPFYGEVIDFFLYFIKPPPAETTVFQAGEEAGVP